MARFSTRCFFYKAYFPAPPLARMTLDTAFAPCYTLRDFSLLTRIFQQLAAALGISDALIDISL